MSKLWQKEYDLDTLMERFTVGRDPEWDILLVPADCIASAAHARMLESIGILDREQREGLTEVLAGITQDSRDGVFPITVSDEDCHTAIENRLVSRLGETGKRIHTGRSRNDQVLAALRIFTRSALLLLMEETAGLSRDLAGRAVENREVPMPGRTHMQPAMPSSVGLWMGAFAEELADLLEILGTAYDLNNQSPLGSAASYGVPLPLDRELTARLLAFPRLQNNVLYVNNSRGKFESIVLDAAEQVALTLSKMAADLILFSLPEFRYFSLPDRLCSGSSIMPQKKNPDGLELIRAKTGSIGACAIRIKNVIRALPSGYNRDFQETKEPLLEGLRTTIDCVRVMRLSIRELEIHPERLAAGFTPDIFATDAALRLVEQGMNFRDAYRQTGLNLDSLVGQDPVQAIGSRLSTGTTGNLNLEPLSGKLDRAESLVREQREMIRSSVQDLMGEDLEICSW